MIKFHTCTYTQTNTRLTPRHYGNAGTTEVTGQVSLEQGQALPFEWPSGGRSTAVPATA